MSFPPPLSPKRNETFRCILTESLSAMAAALDHFFDRLEAEARSDLLALAKITLVKSHTA